MCVARPKSDQSEAAMLPVRMNESDKADWTSEADRLAKLAGRADARGNLARLIKALLRQHMEQPAKTRNKAAKYFRDA